MAKHRQPPRVFSIPSGVPFLPTLADALLAGRLVSFDPGDPLSLAGVTVLLPTRRAVRAFSDVLVERLGVDGAILPAIRPMGDIDEEEQLLDPLFDAFGGALTLPPAILPLARRLALTRLTLAWAKTFRGGILGLKAEDLRIPASAADAMRLAGDLARLIDDMEIAQVPWSALAGLVPDEQAEYFQLTLDFLRIVSERWPEYLRDNNRVDPAARRDSLIRTAAERIAEHGSPGPIVAAGSTGSVPATAELLLAISRQANGAVVLPGLDRHLDEAGWEAIGDGAAGAASFGHPQFALKRLIAGLEVGRADVPALLESPPNIAARSALLSESVRPSSTLKAWAGIRAAPEALDGVRLVVARNEQEEATAIALAIREAIDKPGATAALVTPDRTLARRVAAELGRWHLAIDDSAGAPLGSEPHGVFARLLAEAAASSADPVKLLALAKHPLAAFGMDRAACREGARFLELALFRGHRVGGGIAALPAALAKAKAQREEKHGPAGRRRLRPHHWDMAAELADALVACLNPLETASAAPVSAAQSAALLIEALRRAATDETGTEERLWQGAGGAALAAVLEETAADTEAAALMLAADDFPYFLGALLADVRVQRHPGADPRIHIWGTLEARLQTADLIVLGGLDEGVWPSAARSDPWLSRTMRASLALAPPERRLGLAAHDFFQGLASPRVVVTRAEKRGGAPTVESRWLQRLGALIGKDAVVALRAGGDRLLDLARRLDDVPRDKVTPVKRPAPKPPLAVRPPSLSVTEVEMLIRDPYAIYAKHILKLRPLDPLGRPPDGGLRGTLVHDALGRFTAEWRGAYDAAAETGLVAIAREVLVEVADFPDVHAVWSIRMTAIARWLVAFEAARDAGVERRFAEIAGEMAVIPGVFTLRGRADRVDLMRDGTLAIYDYKTSTPQSERSVFAGLTPQMTLEAAMARAGGFPGMPANLSVSELAWLKLGVIPREEPYQSAVQRGETADALAERARDHLQALAAAFAQADHPYLSRARPRMESARYIGDYDHLARVREWALVESPADIAALGTQR